MPQLPTSSILQAMEEAIARQATPQTPMAPLPPPHPMPLIPMGNPGPLFAGAIAPMGAIPVASPSQAMAAFRVPPADWEAIPALAKVALCEAVTLFEAHRARCGQPQAPTQSVAPNMYYITATEEDGDTFTRFIAARNTAAAMAHFDEAYRDSRELDADDDISWDGSPRAYAIPRTFRRGTQRLADWEA